MTATGQHASYRTACLLQDTGKLLLHERQQLKLELQQALEQLLVQLRGAAALHARAQDRIQRRTDTPGLPNDDTAAEKLPLLRHVTGQMLL